MAYSGAISPPSDWISLDNSNQPGRNARIRYKIRVICDEHYYNSTCTVLCKPRDDFFGHYTCGGKGQKVCQSGWSGENCEKPLCPDGCLHGTCERPGVCQCRNGYKGARCDECQAYPGCKNGFCHKPWECRCYKNWGGILCDKGQWAKQILMTINFSLLIFQIIFSFHWKTFFFISSKKNRVMTTCVKSSPKIVKNDQTTTSALINLWDYLTHRIINRSLASSCDCYISHTLHS